MTERWPQPGFLHHLRVPAAPPWTDRRHPADADPRDDFNRDRDRVIHSWAFRAMQHKTQVFMVHEADFYRTRLTHSMEVAQIARTIARLMGLQEALAEAIALAHDLGHGPFGHAGEAALAEVLGRAADDLKWDANQHTLLVVDHGERLYVDHPGLNLTLATRQGLARHQSPFDNPHIGFDNWPSPSLECQVVNVADFVVYTVHDVKDAVRARILTMEELWCEPALELWRAPLVRAKKETAQAGLNLAEEVDLLLLRAGRHLLDSFIHDVVTTAQANVREEQADCLDAVVSLARALVDLSPGVKEEASRALQFMIDNVYRSPLVARQNFKARRVILDLFSALTEDIRLLPKPVRDELDLRDERETASQVARFIAGLTDRGALDLHAELFNPRDRAMGYHRG